MPVARIFYMELAVRRRTLAPVRWAAKHAKTRYCQGQASSHFCFLHIHLLSPTTFT
jgi:hypothetical protein